MNNATYGGNTDNRIRLGLRTITADDADPIIPHACAVPVRASKEDDPVRAAHIDRIRAKRPRSNWRDVLAKFPEGGTRVEVR